MIDIKKIDAMTFLCSCATCIYIILLYTHSTFRVIFELIFIILLGCNFLLKRKTLNLFMLWSLLFITLALFTLLWSESLGYSLTSFFGFLEACLVANVLIGYLDSEKKIEFVIKAFAFAGMFLILVLLINIPLSEWFAQRLGSTKYNSNEISILLSVSALSLIIIYIKEKNIIRCYRIIFPVLFSLYIFVSLLTGSKKGFVFLVGSIIFVYIINIRKKSKLIFVIPIICLLLYLLFLLIMQNEFLYTIIGRRFDSVLYNLFGYTYGSYSYASAQSDEYRYKLIKIGIDLWKEAPFFGHGLGSYEIISGMGMYSHNNYIELLVGTGLIGLLLYYSIYIYLLINLGKYIKQHNQFINMIFVIIVLLLICEFAYVSYAGEIWFIIFAIAYSLIQLEKNNSKLSVDYSKYLRANR